MNKNRKIIFFIVLLIIGLLTVSLFTPLTDTSEARYGTIAKTMVDQGDILSPKVWIDGKLIPFMGKPLLGFWMIAVSLKLFGTNELAARLPSILSYLFLLGIIYIILKRYSSQFTATAAFLITATTTPFFLLANAVMVDEILALFSIGAIFLYYAYLQEKEKKLKKRWSLLVFVFLGFAFITKGPVALVYFGVPIFCWTLLSGKWITLKDHAWISGISLFLLITFPCFIAAEIGMPGFLKYFFVNENFLRYITPDYGDLYSSAPHKLFLGAAIPMTMGACAPWILFPVYKFLIPLFHKRKRKENTKKFSFKEYLIKIREKCNSNDTIFPVGVVALMLFWSCSSNIMFYYLILIVPLFGTWLAQFMRNSQIKIKTITTLSIILVSTYIIISIPVISILNDSKSSKKIVKKAISICLKNPGAKTKIMFVRRIPYSGYFYGGDRIVPHAKETVEKSIERGVENSSTVFIMKNKYWDRLPENLRKKLKIQVKQKIWIVATVLKEK